MTVRLAKKKDLPEILEIISLARAFMAGYGNPEQWADYPSEALIKEDIEKGLGLVCESEEGVEGYLARMMQPESAYGRIDGKWAKNAPYLTLHRMASRGRRKGVSAAFFDFVKNEADYIRADTYIKNIPMQKAFEKAGFVFRGRFRWEEVPGVFMAYDWVKDEEE